MRKFSIALCVILMLSIAVSASAYSINYSYSLGNGGFTSPYASATVETFDGGALLWTWSGSGQVVNGPSVGNYAPPYGPFGADTTNYMSVPKPFDSSFALGNTYTATLSGTYTYFGLWWGSVDDYNTLSFYNGDTLVASITGTQAIAPYTPSGSWTGSDNNMYVNIWGLPEFNKFSMYSRQYAFEADNIAVGVPEPLTLILLGSGLLGLLGLRRKIS